MRGPHVHVTGVRGWLQHHHEGTTIDGADAAVRLLTREESDDSTAECDPSTLGSWLERDQGGALLPMSWASRGCEDGPEVLVPDGEGFRVLSLESDREFSGVLDAASHVTSDHEGRIWLLSSDGLELVAWDSELRVLLSELALPATCHRVAVGPGGIAAASESGLLYWRPFDEPFVTVDLDVDPSEVLTGLIPLGTSFLALLVAPDGRGRLVEVRGGERLETVAIAGIDCPTMLIPVDDDEFYLSERTGSPPAKTRLQRFRWREGLLPVGEAVEVRGFDGRVVVSFEGSLLASWEGGLRQVYGVRTRYQTDGFVETIQFDSRRQLCRWDRVFLDVCTPQGCGFTVEARTSDTLEPESTTEPVAAPPGLTTIENGQRATLAGSTLTTGGSAWMPVLGFDDLGPNGDVPQVGALGRSDVAGRWTTIEGFLTNPPGRYLWLRVRLSGTRSATPRLFGARITYPRPNVLDLLPAFWQRVPANAEKMGRFLALFEAELTRTDALIRHLHYMFDPRSTPTEALEWLASWVGISLDSRIPLDARRTLVREAVELFQKRGTVEGLKRVIEITSGVQAVMIEGFRVRRRDAPVLGTGFSTTLGDALPLGGTAPVADNVNPRVVAGWQAGMVRRDQRRREHGQPCPEDAPPNPALEPGEEFYSAYAHRFTVVLIGDVCDERLDATNDAIEAWKPAHTVHSLCVTEAGVRVGQTARPGYSAIAVESTGPTPGVLGEDLIMGARFTMGPHHVLRTVRQLPADNLEER